MSLLFEITIKPGISKTYWRLVLVIYLLSCILIFYSSIYLLIKIILTGVIFFLLRHDWINKSPNIALTELQFIENQWILNTIRGPKRYDEARVLIHNVLFQLLQFTSPEHQKFIVLFHDQVSNMQLRLLHLKITENKKHSI